MVKRITKAQKEKRKNIIFAIILGVLLTSNSITGYGLYKVSKQNKDLQAQITSLYNNVKPQNTKNDYLEDDADAIMQKINELTSMQYVIKSGDTLSEIVHSKYGKYDYKLLMSLAKYNNIQNVDKIVSGEVISLPSVDELNEIALSYNIREQNRPAKNLAQQINTFDTKEFSSLKENVKNNTNEIEVVKSQTNEIANDVSQNKSDIQTLSEKTETTNTAVSENKANISQINETISENKTDILEIKKDVASLKNEINEVKQEKTSNINAEQIAPSFSQTEIDTIHSQISSLENDFNSQNAKFDEIYSKLVSIENALNDVKENKISKDEVLNLISNLSKPSEPQSVSDDKTSETKVEEVKVFDEPVKEVVSEPEQSVKEFVEPTVLETEVEPYTDTEIIDDVEPIILDNNNYESPSEDIIEEDKKVEIMQSWADKPIEEQPIEDEGLNDKDTTDSVDPVFEIDEPEEVAPIEIPAPEIEPESVDNKKDTESPSENIFMTYLAKSR